MLVEYIIWFMAVYCIIYIANRNAPVGLLHSELMLCELEQQFSKFATIEYPSMNLSIETH